MKIIFIKCRMMNGREQVVGQRATVWPSLGKQLIESGIALEYQGSMKNKVKFKLSNLK